MDMNDRIYNFSAGPSMLPIEVLESIRGDVLNYKASGMSVMEMSHRSSAFSDIIGAAEENLRKLLGISSEYSVMFLQGGGTLQFSMVPLNLMNKNNKADYVITGAWAKKAYQEASRFGDACIASSSENTIFSYIPKLGKDDFRQDADYVHITSNNTIYGTYFQDFPNTGNVDLVADMSSELLSREIDINKFSLIYAGAQKNIGPAGLTIVIARKSILGKARENTPIYLDYSTHSEANSLYNTPPAWCIYVAGEVFKNLLDKGGLKEMENQNRKKASKLYDFIDSSKLYKNPNAREDRSLMNVVFVTGNKDLDKKFISEARANGLAELGGHRSIGGMRASIYNACPMEGVDALIKFMSKFEKENGA
jgi:phosphoserine aminotransferase